MRPLPTALLEGYAAAVIVSLAWAAFDAPGAPVAAQGGLPTPGCDVPTPIPFSTGCDVSRQVSAHGRVVSGSGWRETPIAGALVQLSIACPAATTDAAGRFTLGPCLAFGCPPCLTFDVTANGYRPWRTSMAEFDAELRAELGPLLSESQAHADPCPAALRRVPAAEIARAAREPWTVGGYGLRAHPNVPPGPRNPLRNRLDIVRDAPWHPLYNSLVWSAGCR